MTTTLYRSSDRKVTNLVTPSSKGVKISNTFGLPAGSAFSCPGATSFCDSICYAGKIERQYVAVTRRLVTNFEALLYADYLHGVSGMITLLAEMMDAFVEDCVKHNAPKKFRIHWDGDFFSESYAEAWASIVFMYPDIQFWVYTRSFTESLNVLPIITGFDNLVVYISADPVNIVLANKRASEYPGTFIATVADTFAEARETIINASRKGYNCPENGKRIPLISTKGSACVSCGVCVAGRGDVMFSVKKR